jgi:hypothetical protein
MNERTFSAFSTIALTSSGKLLLLDMAQAWIALAKQAEKNGETILFRAASR